METATAAAPGPPAESSTNSKTVADLAPLAAERHAAPDEIIDDSVEIVDFQAEMV